MRTSKARLHQLGCWRGWLFRNHSRGAWNFEVKSWGHQMGGPIFGGESNLIQIYGNFERFPEKNNNALFGLVIHYDPYFFGLESEKLMISKFGFVSFQTFIFRWRHAKICPGTWKPTIFKWQRFNWMLVAKWFWFNGKGLANHHFHPFKTGCLVVGRCVIFGFCPAAECYGVSIQNMFSKEAFWCFCWLENHGIFFACLFLLEFFCCTWIFFVSTLAFVGFNFWWIQVTRKKSDLKAKIQITPGKV